ncbi:MAG: 16S rRNA (guanine(966)-N(2))-methyltransferase RsmD [Alphaproteobacteria bacterium]|nr:MAG: 16S rRNA (guanine(966)-N(2))-methyltransferase RsmD [Alphaproteobacteria bacterium]
MRITTGIYKGRKLSVPPGNDIRPTSDRARQALYNILSHGKPASIFDLPIPQKLSVLDVFCGSGALGLEALSRGADYACFIDRDIKTARANAEDMKATGICDFISADALNLPPAREQFDLVFLDPPYNQGLIAPCIESLRQNNWLSPRALIVIESAAKEEYTLPELELLDERVYGAAKIRFYLFAAK